MDECDFWKWQLHYCYHPLITSLVISERNESRRWQTNAALISISKRPDVNWAENEPGGQRDEGRRFVTDEWKTAGWKRGWYRGVCEKLWVNNRVGDLGRKCGQWRLHYNICEEPAESLVAENERNKHISDLQTDSGQGWVLVRRFNWTGTKEENRGGLWSVLCISPCHQSAS